MEPFGTTHRSKTNKFGAKVLQLDKSSEVKCSYLTVHQSKFLEARRIMQETTQRLNVVTNLTLFKDQGS